MSTPPSTISSPFVATSSLPLEERLSDTPPSPTLSECIQDAPPPLPLSERIETIDAEPEELFSTPLPSGSPVPSTHADSTPPSPTPSDDTISVCMDHMEGFSPPFGYKYYDKTDLNHALYGFEVPLGDGFTSKPPHLICFDFDTNNHLHHLPRHSVSVTRRGNAGLDYGETLVAKVPPNLPNSLVDNCDLVTLAAVNADSQAVDIAMIALDNPVVSADVDRL
jgi:hypothetical protein